MQFTLWTHGLSKEFCHYRHKRCFVTDSCFAQVLHHPFDVLRLWRLICNCVFLHLQVIVRQWEKGTAWDGHQCQQSELSYAVRAAWSSTRDPYCESSYTYVHSLQVIDYDKSQATRNKPARRMMPHPVLAGILQNFLNNRSHIKKGAFQNVNVYLFSVLCTFVVPLLHLISTPLLKPSPSHCLLSFCLSFIG